MSRTAEGYRRWAETEAHGSSAIYERWAMEVATSDDLIALIDELPAGKRQPNLIFAAARWHGVDERGPIAFELFRRWRDIRATVLARSTQTNEPARCAALLFALARIDGPIALIEVGASAGLCLILDRYDYRFTGNSGEAFLVSTSGRHVLSMECAVEGTKPPSRMPDIRWRLGTDLSPVDLSDRDERAWLETLIWPEHDDRRERFRLAWVEWSANPPEVMVGDVLGNLDSLTSRIPSGMTTVVMHSAVFAYLPPAGRALAADAITSIADHQISLEGAEVLPNVAAVLPAAARARSSDFVLALNGAPLGLASPHGGHFEAFTS